jgi:hypothetical protein
MSRTPLSRYKERAYQVGPVPTEPRVRLGAVTAVAWDLANDRLLYARHDVHWNVPKGTDFPRLPPFHAVTAVYSLSSPKMPLADSSQGTLLAILDDEPLTSISLDEGAHLPIGGGHFVEALAVDAETGSWVAYSSTQHVPYRTRVDSFDSTGGRLSQAEVLHPADQADVLHFPVPNCIVAKGNAYGIERVNSVFTSSPAPARVVRRGLGSLGGESAHYDFTNPLVDVHSLAADPETNSLWVLVTDNTFIPGSFLVALGLDSLAYRGLSAVNFGLADYALGRSEQRSTYIDGDLNPHLGGAGGFLVFDGREGADPVFVSSGLTPAGFDPAHPAPGDSPLGTFRWLGTGSGHDRGNMGTYLQGPIFKTATGYVGSFPLPIPRI